jgi:hypothetical protein
VQVSYAVTQGCVFVSAAAQLGEKLPPGVSGRQFDWENKLVMKLSLSECGAMLSVLNDRTDSLDFIHSSSAGYSTMKLVRTLHLYAHVCSTTVYVLISHGNCGVCVCVCVCVGCV